MGGQLQPAIRTGTEAQAANAALVHEILIAFRSALVRRMGNPFRALNNREAEPGTRCREHARRHHRNRPIPPNTANACPVHRGRSPAVEGHHTDRRTLQETEGHCGRYGTTHRRAHAARASQQPPAEGGTTRHLWDRLTSPETPTMGVKPMATRPAINRDDPGRADLTRESPTHNPTTQDSATHSADACRADAPARVTPGCPTYAAGTQQTRASPGSPTTRAIEHEH